MTLPVILGGSVGANGKNSRRDTKLAQFLLNGWRMRHQRTPIRVDGLVGPQTTGAIADFQRTNKMRTVDGRIDPAGPTIMALVAFHFSSIAGDFSGNPKTQPPVPAGLGDLKQRIDVPEKEYRSYFENIVRALN